MNQNKFRCHFSIVFENLGSAFWFIFMGFLTMMDDLNEAFIEIAKGGDVTSDALFVAGILLVLLLIVFSYHCIRWSKTWISIEENAIVIERRTLKRNINTIGMNNISNINMEQNLFERLMGTYKIKLDTDSKTTADSTDVKIVLSKSRAAYFKEQVMFHMNEKKADIDSETEEYDVSYTAGDIVAHCFYTAGIISILIFAGTVLALIGGIHSLRIGDLIVDGLINVLGSLIAIITILGSVLQGLVKDFFVYYGFRARRKENKIYLYHGLLKKRQYTLAVDKINAVQVVSTTLSRVLKRQYVKVICVGVGDEENENSMLLLSETKEEMKRKLSVLLPEFVLEEPDIIRREKNSVFSEIPGCIVLYGILIAGAVLAGGFNIFTIPKLWIRILIAAGCIFVMLVHLIGLYMNFCTCGIGLGKDILTLENGIFQKVITWIPYHKIQQIQYVQGPVCKYFGLAKGIIFILANMMDSFYGITYANIEIFEKLREKILMRQGIKGIRFQNNSLKEL